MTDVTAPRVYSAIAAVMADLAKDGIGKDRSNQAQGYKFRGIDDVYNALSPVLSRHNLCMLPRILAREVVERQNAKGTALFYVTVEAEFDLICAEDGSMHTVRTFGEAMDSGDKATNKAMSAAYKYAAMQAFAIPTEGDNDADATTHEDIASKTDGGDRRRKFAKADDSRQIDKEMRAEIDACGTEDELRALWASKPFKDELKKHPEDWEALVVEYFNQRLADIKADAATKTGASYKPPVFEDA